MITNFYKGKVRDVWTIQDKYLLMLISNRISAFDHILPETIPYKGQVLNGIATHFLNATQDIVKNWLISTPYSNVAYGYKCKPFPVEFIVRGYLSGSAWRQYKSGLRNFGGITLPDGMNENDRLPVLILTPTTKENDLGQHDQDITAKEIVNNGLMSGSEWEEVSEICFRLFERGSEMANERGLILVDTKYEFGKLDGEIMLIDEIHTPDSSRYFYLDTYEENQKTNKPQEQLSKEFVRQWLMDNGFSGKNTDIMPIMSQEFIYTVSQRYQDLYTLLTGDQFKPGKELDEQDVLDIDQIHKIIYTS